MSTMRELDAEVQALLTADMVARYDNIMARVADARSTFTGLGKLVHQRAGAQFRVNTGLVRRSGKTLEIDVRVAGRSIGALTIESKTSRQFTPHKTNFRDLRDWHAGCSWLEPCVATYVNEVIKAGQANDRNEFDPEARVEAAFIAAFNNNERWTKDLEIVRVGNLAYQVPVPIGGSERSKKTSGGFIDALTRVGRGQGFRVFELKKPEATRKDVVLSVRQAVTYALVLKALLIDKEAMGYRRAVTGNAHGRLRDRITFVATPFVSQAKRDVVDEACAAIVAEPVDGVEVRPLYYQWDERASTLSVPE